MKFFTALPLLLLSALWVTRQTEAKRFLVKSYGPAPEGSELIVTYGNKTISVIDCDQTMAEDIKVLPTVDKVEEDHDVFLEPIEEYDEVFPQHRNLLTNQQPLHPGLWGLDLIDHKVDQMYSYQGTGKDITVYVIDSGVNLHDQFKDSKKAKSRVVGGKAFGGSKDWKDCNGHGTHVASTIAGKTFGVAKKAQIVSVRVFGCTGGSSWSTIIEAIYWIIKQKKKGPVNMSLSGGKNTIVNEAITDLRNAGFLPVVAAGNARSNACFYSPASSSSALTVGCIGEGSPYNTNCWFSNEGPCVDIFAPGLLIWGADIPKGGTYKSGTSMSSPHAAGVAALLKKQYPNKNWKQIGELIIDLAAEGNLILSRNDSPNLSLRIDNGRTSAPVSPFPTPSPTPAPTVTPKKPKCYKTTKKKRCNNRSACKWYTGTGCRNANYCGFKSFVKCLAQPHCDWHEIDEVCFLK